MIINKFFTSIQGDLYAYDKYIGETHAIVPGIDNFKIIVNLAEELYPDDKPFTKNIRNRKQQCTIIRQCCYLVANEVGLTYSHMVRVLNDMHDKKVSHHSTMLHGAKKTRIALEIKDKTVLPIWSNIMAEMQKRNFSKTFVSLAPVDAL